MGEIVDLNQQREEQDTDPVMVTLLDEAGAEHEFEVVDVIEFEYAGEKRDYALLVPQDSTEEDDDPNEMLILRLDPDGDTLEMIEDEAEFEAVAAYIESLPDEE